jgi:adenylate cyclase
LVFSGRPQDGYQVLLNYLRLNPHDPRNWEALHVVAIARYLSGEYAGAINAARRAIRANPGQPLSYRWLAAGLGQIGRTHEARELLHDAEAIVAPLAIDTYLRRRWPWQRQDDHDHMLEGLRKAGWRG